MLCLRKFKYGFSKKNKNKNKNKKQTQQNENTKEKENKNQTLDELTMTQITNKIKKCAEISKKFNKKNKATIKQLNIDKMQNKDYIVIFSPKKIKDMNYTRFFFLNLHI